MRNTGWPDDRLNFQGSVTTAILPGGNIPSGMQAPSTNPAKPVWQAGKHMLCVWLRILFTL